MTSADLLADAFGRICDGVHGVVGGLTPAQLTFRLDSDANTIGWLVWHLTRVQDDHIADVAHAEQAWTAAGWVQRFGLPFQAHATGYGHRAEEVAAVKVESGELLTGYHDAVYERTLKLVRGLTDADLPQIVDERWDPPVSLGVRLISVIEDDMQHVGQAAFIRGVLLRQTR